MSRASLQLFVLPLAARFPRQGPAERYTPDWEVIRRHPVPKLYSVLACAPGEWLAVNGEAIFESRPRHQPASKTGIVAASHAYSLKMSPVPWQVRD
jgi:hypothetical protein